MPIENMASRTMFKSNVVSSSIPTRSKLENIKCSVVSQDSRKYEIRRYSQLNTLSDEVLT